MIILSTGNVYFFETQKDIEVSGLYATIRAEELGVVIQRFASWGRCLRLIHSWQSHLGMPAQRISQ